MASARVVSVLMVCGVIVRGGGVHEQGARSGRRSEDSPGSHYVTPTSTTTFIPITRPQARGNFSAPVSRDEQKKHPSLQRRIGYNQEELYPLLIPVKLGVNPELIYTDQHSRRHNGPSDIPRAALNSSPRLIMDKDFNIRFDNPYILPVSKPLAFVLDSSAAGRSMAGAQYNKMMIPFPVLVQARSPIPENEEYRGPGKYRGHEEYRGPGEFRGRGEYRGPGEYRGGEENRGIEEYRGPGPGEYREPGEYRAPEEHLEHRSNDDDDFFPGESFGRHPPRKLARNRKPWKNITSTYREHSGPKRGGTNDSPLEEDGFEESTEGPSVYPSKIFEDMYRSMSKYPADSQESRERERSHDDYRRKKYSRDKETPSRERPRKYSRQPAYSATRDLEWVAPLNSTTPGADKYSRGVTSTTTNPLQPPTPDLFQPTTAAPARAARPGPLLDHHLA